MSPYRLYLLICGLGSFAAKVAFTLNLVYQATVVGLSPLQLVLVGTVMEGVCFVAQVPTGVIADVVSRRLSVIVGYLLMGAGLLVWGLFPSFAAVLVANVIWSIGAVCVDGAEEAWAADEIEPGRVTTAFVRAGQVGQAGSLAGILAAIGLGYAGLAVPIVVGGALTLALGVLVMVLMKEERWTPTATRNSMRRQVVAGGPPRRRRRQRRGGPTWSSSQSRSGQLCRKNSTTRSCAAGVPSQAAGSHSVQVVRPLWRRRSTRG
jgi:DHA3 family tetracycline resistance protein-like MFS transporter